MNITEKTIPHIYRNKYLKNSGSTTIVSGGATTNNSSGDTVYVVDNLTSTGTTSALSANLGRILKGMVDETNEVLQEHITYSKDNFLSKKEEDTAELLIHFLNGIDAQGLSTLENITLLGDLLSSNFVLDSNGFGIYLDADGKYHLDIDNVSVRGKFTTEVLEVKESKHIGGKFYSTKAGMICSKVEEYDTYYRCYFKTADSEGRTIFNQFAKDDLAFMQTFNMSNLADGKIGNRRFWRLVVAIGDDYIDLSKTDCESGSDKPIAGDSIVLLGNTSDTSRLGAIIFEPLYFRVYKGIKSYSLPTPFIDLNPDESRIEAKLINVATGVDVNDTFNSLNSLITLIKNQLDRCFTIWFEDYEPTLDNLPASEWTNNSLKNEHLQDIFYNTAKEAGSGGRAYRFELNNSVYSWVEITDKDTIAALELAKAAEDLADSKRRVFVALPTNDSVYDVGDIWVNATYGTTYKNDELVCITAKAAGEAFSISHWLPTSEATTAYIENLGNLITLAVEDIDSAKSLILINSDSISALSGKVQYDEATGKITNISTSGLVTTADFATMFSELVTEDGLVSRADISTFITEDEAGELISNATISADKIDFIGKTTINGNFVVDEAGNVTMNNATVNGTINANAGTIGGLTINGNALTNEGFDNDAYIVMRNDANKVFCGIGGNVLPSITGSSAVARFENESDGGNANDPYHSNYGANFAAILSAKNARYNIALAMNGGFILGMALRTDILTSSQTISRGTNVVVTLSNDALINVTLPTMYDYDDGHLVIICNLGSYGGIVYAGTNVENGTTRNSYISSEEDGNKIQANNSKGVHRMGFIYCHYISTTIADTPFSGCWLRIF